MGEVASTGMRRRAWRRVGVLLGVILGLCSMAAISASTALAARTYDSKVTPFNHATGVAFDGTGAMWAVDIGQFTNPPGQAGLYKYDGYPSQTILSTTNSYLVWGFSVLALQDAVDRSTGDVYVAMSNGRTVDIFDNSGKHLRSWSGINGASSGAAAQAGIHIAIDNTNSYSAGRVYLSLTAPENDVEAVDTEQRPVPFPATATYISGNKLTGTPSGAFGEVQHIAVDELGNIYVTDASKNLVDEFASTGEFSRSFPAPAAAAGNPGNGGVAIDPTNGDVLITESIYNSDADTGGVAEYDASGNFLGRTSSDSTTATIQSEGTPAFDSAGRLYLPLNNRVDIFAPVAKRPAVTYAPDTSPSTTGATLNAEIDPNGGGPVTTCKFEYGTTTAYSSGTLPCAPNPAASPPGSNFTTPTAVSANLAGLTTETTYHYRVVVENANSVRYGWDRTFTPHNVVGLRTDAATNVGEADAELNGSLVGDGSHVHYLFEWGKTSAYGHTTAVPPGQDAGFPTGPGRTQLSPYHLEGLEPFATYHYRVVAEGGSGTSYGDDQVFTTTPGVPTIGHQTVSSVHSDRATLRSEVDAHGGRTTYRFEYVTDEEFQESEFDGAASSPQPSADAGMGKGLLPVSVEVDGLEPDTLYHFRTVASNDVGTGVASVGRTFRTYKFGFEDSCANAHVRQQTGAAQLLDCRAYELASASNAGGYDVESDLVPGQTPFGGFPLAVGPSRILYGVHNGGVPGSGKPTNKGVDTYVATRGDNGWTTRYVGIPADNPFASEPFATTLEEADSKLETLAFGGPEICSPCFEDGSTGLPIHLRDGSLVQGMAGSIDPGPGAEPAGYIGRRLSADGGHFVFGSTSKFEPDGNSNGDVSIYDRDLTSGVTHVVSKTPGEATMTGPGIGELDISADGSRIVFGQLVSEDAEGNRYWHLYMNIGDSDHSIDLTPATGAGALYDGMTSDGTKVYFSTADPLVDDADTSVDIYRADVTPSGASLERVSTGTGGTGDVDTCDPSANTRHARWNRLGTEATCDVLAVGGEGGVASVRGTIYFLSPEALDTSNPDRQPVEDAPNLYVAEPGSDPQFVATLESSSNAPLPPSSHPFRRSFGSFGNPAGVAIDNSNGDVYVFDIGTSNGAGFVYKFKSSGQADLGFANSSKLEVPGVIGFANLPTGLAVDNDPGSPNYRRLFVPNLEGGQIRVYEPTGAAAFNITGLTLPSDVAINPSNGDIYVTSYFGGVQVFAPNGTPKTNFPTISNPTGVAVDSSGRVYVVNGGGFFGATGTVEVYDSSGNDLEQLDSGPANGVGVDPADDHVFVDKVDEVREYDPAGNPIGSPIGSGLISQSIGVAAASGSVVITNRGATNVASYGPPETPSDPNTDNPLVVDSLSQSATRYRGDFQVTPSGDNAVFSTTLPLVDYENLGHREVIRYDAPTDGIVCASCNPTGEPASGEATLPANGLGLSDDGRVFFNSTEGLVDRDLNDRKDAYEWKSGEGTELISTGTGPLDSSLLGVSADATDAYFFTRDTLVNGDENGNRVKIYDARVLGGDPYVPPEIPCKASDECHGPGSQVPSDPNVGTIAGTAVGNFPAKKPGKCKRKHKGRKHKGRHQSRPKGCGRKSKGHRNG